MHEFELEYLNWIPLLWVCVFLIIMVLFIIIGKLFFRDDFDEMSEQGLPFYSGTSNKMLQLITASNLYWGFKHTLQSYFNSLNRLFISNLGDFIQWFIIIVAIMLLIITGALM